MAVRADDERINGLMLCSGIGGFDLGLRRAIGPGYRTVGHVEREAFSAAILVARMADARLDPAPVWDDLLTFDGRPWRGVVDLVAAGFPCQPWSLAGKRAGVEDERWIWPEVARVLGEVRPRWALLENVPGLLAGDGLGHVLGDLAALGFDAEWSVFSADQVGATHRRERLFIMANSDRNRLESERIGCIWDEHRQTQRNDADRCGGPQLADADRSRLEVGRGERADADRWQQAAERGGLELVDQRTASGSFDADRQRGPLAGRYPPGPRELREWACILAMSPKLEPAVCRVAHGVPDRMDRLRALGNAVVPEVVALAWTTLRARFDD